MIDWTKPIQLETGQHCYVTKVYPDKSYNIIVPAGYGKFGKDASFVMYPNGTHAFGLCDLRVQNVVPALSDEELAAKFREVDNEQGQLLKEILKRGYTVEWANAGTWEPHEIDDLTWVSRIFKKEVVTKEL